MWVFQTSPNTTPPQLGRSGNVLSYSLSQDEDDPDIFLNAVIGHNMTRSNPSINSNGMNSSNSFYAKIVDGHEARHVTQWTSISPYSELYQPNSIYELFNDELKSGSASDVITWQNSLELEAGVLYAQYIIDCNTFRSTTADCREQDAHNYSNGIAPNYLNANLSSEYQSCPSPMPSIPDPER